MADRPPYVCEPTDQSSGRPATFIFLHGYGDDAEGLPLGLAQQFQFHSKIPYLRWVLPNAPHNTDAMTRAWYMPKALPNSLKPHVPNQAEEDESTPDDEDGILATVDKMDKLVQEEVDRGVDPSRIIIGGFSQGCAVSLVWGQIGKMKDKVAGVVCLSGYFPLADRIAALRKERGLPQDEKWEKKWFYIHGKKDMLVPMQLFNQGKEELCKWIKQGDMEEHVYEGMGHSTDNRVLRDLLGFLSKVVPP